MLRMMPHSPQPVGPGPFPGPVPGLSGAVGGPVVGVVLGVLRPADGLVTGGLGVVCDPASPPEPATPVEPLVPRLAVPADDDGIALVVGMGVVVDEVVPLELEPQAAATATKAATIGSAYLDLMDLAFMMFKRVGATEVSVSRFGQSAERITKSGI